MSKIPWSIRTLPDGRVEIGLVDPTGQTRFGRLTRPLARLLAERLAALVAEVGELDNLDSSDRRSADDGCNGA